MEAISILNNAKIYYLINTSDQGKRIKNKLETILEKNSGFTAMETITNILRGKNPPKKRIRQINVR